METEKQNYLRKIPKVDTVLKEPAIEELCRIYGKGKVLEGIRQELENFRQFIRNSDEAQAQKAFLEWKTLFPEAVKQFLQPSLQRVLNASGVILHTNLGRAPFGKFQKEAVMQVMNGYANLEYLLKEGCRGKRREHYKALISRVTGSEDALAVNNNAASVILILRALAKNKEVIVSRGELIEIGGHFRIPDVMEHSGAVLREVGCTNRTRLSDYENAVGENTGALLKVHTSNYKMVGFTEEVTVQELAQLGKKYNLPVIVDLGSGVLLNLEKYGLSHEPTVQEVLKQGADLVCFSGDKLLGGPQAGIVAGKKAYIKEMENHPLMRTYRLDKCGIAALRATFLEYLDEERAVQNIPVLRMLTCPQRELKRRAEDLCEALTQSGCPLQFQTEKSVSALGGGALPGETIPSWAVTVKPSERSCEELAQALRLLPVPVIAYVKNEKVWLDMRTILDDEVQELKKELCDYFGGCL